jgi:hypothetical protein
MKSCLLCPRGKSCQGYVLHELLLKLDTAMSERKNADADAIVRQLSQEDLVTFAKMGVAARETCWNKGFVLMVAHRFAELGRKGLPEPALRAGVENVIVRMDMLAAKLPKGIKIDLQKMAMDIYNEAIRLLEEEGCKAFLPVNLLGNVMGGQMRKRA